MLRLFAGLIALVCGIAIGVSNSMAQDRMRFEWSVEGPPERCGISCRTWISASGYIDAYTPRDFEAFVQGRDAQGAVLVLDSDGGSVQGTLVLGRMIRALDMVTTIGRTVELPSEGGTERRATLRPNGTCESMCTFLLLAGARRHVPAEANVLVHQIWIGKKRTRAQESSYTADEVDIIQRDIGRLVRYTLEMGGTADLLETALQVPPWAPLHRLSLDDLHRMALATTDTLFEDPSDLPRSVAGASEATVGLPGKRN